MNKAVILVGGPSRATRFRPLSMNLPQPLFPVGGKPILWHQIKALSQVPDMKEIILLGLFETHVFSKFLDQCSEEFPHIRFSYLREYSVLGTAGGLFHFRDQIKAGKPKNIFLLYTDICSSFPLRELLERHESGEAIGTIMVKKISRDLAKRYGCVVPDEEKKMALHYVDKPETYISDLASTGVYIFTNEIFDHIDKILAARADELEKLPKKAFHDDFDRTQDSLMLESDVLPNLASNKKLGLYITQDFWRQIKTAASAVPANGLYLNSAKQEIPGYCAEGKEGGPEIVGAVYIHPSAVVDPSAKIGPNVSIHAKSHIGAGVRIKDAIILDNVIIKDNAAIINAIVGWGGKIGRWSRVEGNPDNGDEKTDQVTSSGVKIDSICILGQDITVSDEAFVRNSIVLPHKHISSDIHNEIIM